MSDKLLSKFTLGERVCYIGHPRGLHLGVDVGEFGVIVGIDEYHDYISVRWDLRKNERHNCNGLCDDCHGWNVDPRLIEGVIDDLGEILPCASTDVIGDLFGGDL